MTLVSNIKRLMIETLKCSDTIPKCQFLLSGKRCQRPHPQFQPGIMCAGKEEGKYFIVLPYTPVEVGISPVRLQIQARLIRDDSQHISWQLSSFHWMQPLENVNAGVVLAAFASSLTASSARLFCNPVQPQFLLQCVTYVCMMSFLLSLMNVPFLWGLAAPAPGLSADR